MDSKITDANAADKLKECCNLLDAQDFVKLGPLLKRLLEFCEVNCEAGEHENALSTCMELRSRMKTMLLERLETTTVFDQFQQLLQALSEVVETKRELWDILHS